MRAKKHNVCHTCRQHKLGCDGMKPECSQCRLTGRLCRGYVQDLVVLHHKPAGRGYRSIGKQTASGSTKPKRDDGGVQSTSNLTPHTGNLLACHLDQPTWDECVAILVQHYIPDDEIPFLLQVEPSKSRICGGWVQALPHVDQDHQDFAHIISPAVRALTMSMMVTDIQKRKEYLDTYGTALEGIRAVLDRPTDSVGSTVAIAGMCLALSEVLVPISSEGYNTHLRGVAAMMQSCGSAAFKEGVAHLMFVGVRPLMILDAILRRKSTFLMGEDWQKIPFTVHQASRMQVLLGCASAIPPLLEKLEDRQADQHAIRTAFLGILARLHDWEEEFVSEGMTYRKTNPNRLDLATHTRCLPDPCFVFADVSHANSLTHCWAFRIVCLLHLLRCDKSLVLNVDCPKTEFGTYVINLCDLICRGLPYLLQKEMRFYGSMSAGFPLHMVLESLQSLELEADGLKSWCAAIKELMQSQRIALYEEMAETGAYP